MPVARRLALAGIAFPVLFAALVIVQGLVQPEYSHVSMPISALAAFPYGRIQVANFLVAGTLLTLFAVAQHRGLRPTPRGILGPAFQFVGGLGVVGAGLFSWRMVDGVRRGHHRTFLAADGAPLQPWVGLVQRIMCVIWFTWLVLMALRLRRMP